MARKVMVTRTIASTKVGVMTVDVIAGETFTKFYTLGGKETDTAKLLKQVQKLYDTDTLKHAHIVSVEHAENLYGMTEECFIEHAEVLPPREKTEAKDEPKAE